jgi:phospholipid/cholesterol/gamma-HCH transport system substrate-binding protein
LSIISLAGKLLPVPNKPELLSKNHCMKVSNETKVGALTAVAITLLILGFNYLKGKNITTRSDTIYAIFPSVTGVTPSTAVFINGLQVGRVSEQQLVCNDRQVAAGQCKRKYRLGK